MATINKELTGEISEKLGLAAGINIKYCIDRINQELKKPPDEETERLLKVYRGDIRNLMIQIHQVLGKLSADSEDPEIAQKLINISRKILSRGAY